MRKTNAGVSVIGIVVAVALVLVVALAVILHRSTGKPAGQTVTAAQALVAAQRERIQKGAVEGDVLAAKQLLLTPEAATTDWRLVNAADVLLAAKAWRALAEVVAGTANAKARYLAANRLTACPDISAVAGGAQGFREVVEREAKSDTEVTLKYETPVDPGSNDTEPGAREIKDPYMRPFSLLVDRLSGKKTD